MKNTSFIYISLDAVQFFEKPYFDGLVWHNLTLADDEEKILLTETRAAMLGVPVQREEEPAGYIYSIYGNSDECYSPIYDRTDIVKRDRLYSSEIITNG